MTTEQMFYSWNNKQEFQKSIAEYGDFAADTYPISRSTGGVGRTFVNDLSTQSIRSEYHRGDYEHYRKSETVPKDPMEIIRLCMLAYEKVGIVRNVIDLMGDFACKGVSLQHPNPKIENFYQKWFEKVDGKERSERFLNMLYRAGNVVVNSAYGKVNVKDETEWRKTHGLDNDDISLDSPKVRNRTIPLKYSFINPLSIEVVGGEAASFVGKGVYVIKITSALKAHLAKLERMAAINTAAKELYDSIPENIKTAVKKGHKFIPLDQDKLFVSFYKKDDWNLWSKPMTYSILDDLIMLDKMKLADISALDGAISNVRLWTVGVIGKNIQDSILPTRAMMQKIRNILANNVGGGTLDLVWGPELSFTESATKVHEFLGRGKYEPVWDAIYDGLGIPSVLRSSGSSTNANSFMALKTLVERLEYGRMRLEEFWNREIKRVQKAMGYRFPAKLKFEQMVLADESSILALLVQLVDRNILSDEAILEKFSYIPEIEKLRVRRQESSRKVEKAGPYHKPQVEEDLKKIFAQGGTVTPSEVGVELEECKEGEECRNAQQEKFQMKITEMQEASREKIEQQKFKNQKKEQSGRPNNVQETKKRKPKPQTKPQVNAAVALWANVAQHTISEIVTPAYLKQCDKPSARNLSSAQAKELESIKFGVLMTLEPYSEINEEKVYNSLMNNSNPVTADANVLLLETKTEFSQNNEREPTIDETRQIQSAVYSTLK
jgi:hypothetical protein